MKLAPEAGLHDDPPEDNILPSVLSAVLNALNGFKRLHELGFFVEAPSCTLDGRLPNDTPFFFLPFLLSVLPNGLLTTVDCFRGCHAFWKGAPAEAFCVVAVPEDGGAVENPK